VEVNIIKAYSSKKNKKIHPWYEHMNGYVEISVVLLDDDDDRRIHNPLNILITYALVPYIFSYPKTIVQD